MLILTFDVLSAMMYRYVTDWNICTRLKFPVKGCRRKIMADTSATRALALAEEMDATHLPNTGVYMEGLLNPDTGQMVRELQNREIVAHWYRYGMPKSVDYGSMPAWDASTSHQATHPDPNPSAYTLAAIGFMVSKGQDLEQIRVAIQQDNYIQINTLYQGGDLWTDLWNAWEAKGDVMLTNDPWQVWLPTVQPLQPPQQ